MLYRNSADDCHARAVDMKCQVLILDEPTSSLDDDEVEKLFVLMRRLRDEGVGIIFVTHFLEQVYASATESQFFVTANL